MAKRIRSSTRYDRWIFWPVSERDERWCLFIISLSIRRYIDDIFITWNESEKELIKLLDEANTWHRNIKLEYKISKSLPFLDVLLKNDNGILSTSVYHKPAAEPYVTPFISDHPRHVFGNIIQTALMRAVRYSSTFEAFNHGRRYIKLMLLYNG